MHLNLRCFLKYCLACFSKTTYKFWVARFSFVDNVTFLKLSKHWFYIILSVYYSYLGNQRAYLSNRKINFRVNVNNIPAYISLYVLVLGGTRLTDILRGEIPLSSARFTSSKPTNDSSATRCTCSPADPMKRLSGWLLRDAMCPCCRGTRKTISRCILDS